jgi:hypothetical protein
MANMPPRAKQMMQHPRFKQLLGPVFGDPIDAKFWKDENPFFLAHNGNGGKVALRIDCGEQERLGFPGLGEGRSTSCSTRSRSRTSTGSIRAITAPAISRTTCSAPSSSTSSRSRSSAASPEARPRLPTSKREDEPRGCSAAA